MAKREIVWSKNSEIQLREILEFFNKRNKSGHYSIKLYKKFKTELKIVSKNPEIGIKTKLDQIRGLIIEDYILFYEILEDLFPSWDAKNLTNLIFRDLLL
ncbi:MAG: type II toxin-antitoxin system RelE/ParE family toxin [Bacteroidales bacterium]|nr:type II toxin-antitoxin system RelE/ParE family toxin [Bacteroidales bacterium]